MRTMTRAIFTALIASSMMACSGKGGLEAGSSIVAGGGDNGSQGAGGGSPSNPSNPTTIDQVDMKGYADGGTYSGVKTVDLDKTTGELVISLPLGIDSSIMIGNVTVPQLPGVTLSMTIGADGRTYLVGRVPLRYILRSVNVGTIPANRLPNGDLLPAMPAGEYPNLALAVNTNTGEIRKIYIYLGLDSIGVYVESKWLDCSALPVCMSVTVPVKNAAKTKILGYLTLVPAKNSFQGGFFLATRLPAEIAAILDDYFIH